MSNYNPEVDSDEVCDYCETNEYELKEFDGEMLCPQCYWEAEEEALDEEVA
jgi:uncharacterized Zn finger protein (UPF0148 family)